MRSDGIGPANVSNDRNQGADGRHWQEDFATKPTPEAQPAG